MLNFTVTFFITIINFLILFLILRKLLFKPVTNFMAKRAKKIKDSLDEAAELRTKAIEQSEHYSKLLSGAENEALKLISEAEKMAHSEAEKISLEVQKEVALVRQRAQDAALYEREKALQSLVSDIANLATMVASKLIGKDPVSADKKSAEDLVKALEAETKLAR